MGTKIYVSTGTLRIGYLIQISIVVFLQTHNANGLQLPAGKFCFFASSELVHESLMQQVATSATCQGAAKLPDNKVSLGQSNGSPNDYTNIWGSVYIVDENDYQAILSYSESRSQTSFLSEVRVELPTDAANVQFCRTIDVGLAVPDFSSTNKNKAASEFTFAQYMERLNQIAVPQTYLSKIMASQPHDNNLTQSSLQASTENRKSTQKFEQTTTKSSNSNAPPLLDMKSMAQKVQDSSTLAEQDLLNQEKPNLQPQSTSTVSEISKENGKQSRTMVNSEQVQTGSSPSKPDTPDLSQEGPEAQKPTAISTGQTNVGLPSSSKSKPLQTTPHGCPDLPNMPQSEPALAKQSPTPNYENSAPTAKSFKPTEDDYLKDEVNVSKPMQQNPIPKQNQTPTTTSISEAAVGPRHQSPLDLPPTLTPSKSTSSLPKPLQTSMESFEDSNENTLKGPPPRITPPTISKDEFTPNCEQPAPTLRPSPSSPKPEKGNSLPLLPKQQEDTILQQSQTPHCEKPKSTTVAPSSSPQKNQSFQTSTEILEKKENSSNDHLKITQPRPTLLQQSPLPEQQPKNTIGSQQIFHQQQSQVTEEVNSSLEETQSFSKPIPLEMRSQTFEQQNNSPRDLLSQQELIPTPNCRQSIPMAVSNSQAVVESSPQKESTPKTFVAPENYTQALLKPPASIQQNPIQQAPTAISNSHATTGPKQPSNQTPLINLGSQTKLSPQSPPLPRPLQTSTESLEEEDSDVPKDFPTLLNQKSSQPENRTQDLPQRGQIPLKQSPTFDSPKNQPLVQQAPTAISSSHATAGPKQPSDQIPQINLGSPTKLLPQSPQLPVPFQASTESLEEEGGNAPKDFPTLLNGEPPSRIRTSPSLPRPLQTSTESLEENDGDTPKDLPTLLNKKSSQPENYTQDHQPQKGQIPSKQSSTSDCPRNQPLVQQPPTAISYSQATVGPNQPLNHLDSPTKLPPQSPPLPRPLQTSIESLEENDGDSPKDLPALLNQKSSQPENYTQDRQPQKGQIPSKQSPTSDCPRNQPLVQQPPTAISYSQATVGPNQPLNHLDSPTKLPPQSPPLPRPLQTSIESLEENDGSSPKDLPALLNQKSSQPENYTQDRQPQKGQIPSKQSPTSDCPKNQPLVQQAPTIISNSQATVGPNQPLNYLDSPTKLPPQSPTLLRPLQTSTESLEEEDGDAPKDLPMLPNQKLPQPEDNPQNLLSRQSPTSNHMQSISNSQATMGPSQKEPTPDETCMKTFEAPGNQPQDLQRTPLPIQENPAQQAPVAISNSHANVVPNQSLDQTFPVNTNGPTKLPPPVETSPPLPRPLQTSIESLKEEGKNLSEGLTPQQEQRLEQLPRADLPESRPLQTSTKSLEDGPPTLNEFQPRTLSISQTSQTKNEATNKMEIETINSKPYPLRHAALNPTNLQSDKVPTSMVNGKPPTQLIMDKPGPCYPSTGSLQQDLLGAPSIPLNLAKSSCCNQNTKFDKVSAENELKSTLIPIPFQNTMSIPPTPGSITPTAVRSTPMQNPQMASQTQQSESDTFINTTGTPQQPPLVFNTSISNAQALTNQKEKLRKSNQSRSQVPPRNTNPPPPSKIAGYTIGPLVPEFDLISKDNNPAFLAPPTTPSLTEIPTSKSRRPKVRGGNRPNKPVAKRTTESTSSNGKGVNVHVQHAHGDGRVSPITTSIPSNKNDNVATTMSVASNNGKPGVVTVQTNNPGSSSVSVASNPGGPGVVGIQTSGPGSSSVSVASNGGGPGVVGIQTSGPGSSSVSVVSNTRGPGVVGIQTSSPGSSSVSVASSAGGSGVPGIQTSNPGCARSSSAVSVNT